MSIDSLEEVTANLKDERLADEGFIIKSRSMVRVLDWRAGVINLAVKSDDAGNQVRFNFERRSSAIADLIAWMDLPVDDLKQAVVKILQSFEVPTEEIEDD